jgi:hypothetical protein
MLPGFRSTDSVLSSFLVTDSSLTVCFGFDSDFSFFTGVTFAWKTARPNVLCVGESIGRFRAGSVDLDGSAAGFGVLSESAFVRD